MREGWELANQSGDGHGFYGDKMGDAQLNRKFLAVSTADNIYDLKIRRIIDFYRLESQRN